MRCSARLNPRAALIAMLCLSAGHAQAQCPNPALYELGGMPGAICAATIGGQTDYEAVARGRFVSIESSPIVSGSPAVVGRVELDHAAVFMHTEIVGHVWATDGSTIYGLDTSTATNPLLIGRITLPQTDTLRRLRVHGSFVYATDGTHLYIIDTTNPATPVLRSSMSMPGAGFMEDLEVVGSYAYIAIEEGSPYAHSMMIVDISDPVHPHEVSRAGYSNHSGYRISKAPNLGGLYMLTSGSNGTNVELWSLTNPTSPSISAVNATIDPNAFYFTDELKATNTAICYLQKSTGKLFLYAPSNVTGMGSPITLPPLGGYNQLGVDPPFAFMTTSSGELCRVNITATPPSVSAPYLDVVPGYASRVVTLNEGFSALTGPNDVWLFGTPNGAAPYKVVHFKGDPGYTFNPNLLALQTGGVLFVAEYRRTPTFNTIILAYRVTTSPTVGIQYQGSFSVADLVEGMEAGFDANGTRCVYFTTGGFGGASGTLHTLNASNLGSMSQGSAISLTSGVSAPVHYFPGTGFPVSNPRLLVGGGNGKTQILSVAAAGALSSLGVIPCSSQVITNGLPPTAWLIDQNRLKAYDISTPATPVLQSTTLISTASYNSGTALRVIGAFGTFLGVTTSEGDFVEILASSATSPSISKIAAINTAVPDIGGAIGDFMWDGINIHVANGVEGYGIFPLDFPAPPREDPNQPIGMNGTHRIVGICGGSPVVLTAHFVATPAITAYQWLKYSVATQTYVPINNGPTGNGSTISGATTATITITNPSAADQGYFRCQATNSCGTVVSDSVAEARVGGYANCDRSTTPPVLNVNDFSCFLNAFTAANSFDPYYDAYPNCDGSIEEPLFTVLDFTCFLNKMAAGCQ